MSEKKKFGEFLIEKRIISTSQLEEALKKQKDFALPLGDTLLKLKFVSENVLLESLSQYLGLDYLNLAENDFKIIDRRPPYLRGNTAFIVGRPEPRNPQLNIAKHQRTALGEARSRNHRHQGKEQQKKSVSHERSH